MDFYHAIDQFFKKFDPLRNTIENLCSESESCGSNDYSDDESEVENHFEPEDSESDELCIKKQN